MVEAFHDAGIEVILDVVFNHTAEGGEDGPTYNFRGLDNTLYYMLDEQGRYLNFTGCGNTVNSNHPVVRNLHPRLPAQLGGRGGRRRLPVRPGLGPRPRPARQRAGRAAGDRADLRGLRCCADTKLIAEPWDAAGLYQVGTLPRRRPLVGLERPVPRRRPPVLAGRAGHDLGPGHAALRQRRPLPRPRAAPLDQLHHLPRRLHAQRPGLLQPQAQRGQRRGQPRRQRRQLELELRRRGADRRPRGPRAPQPAGPQPDGHAAGLAGRADDPGRRRVPPHPAAATTTPGARTTRSAGSTGRSPSGTPTSSGSSGR